MKIIKTISINLTILTLFIFPLFIHAQGGGGNPSNSAVISIGNPAGGPNDDIMTIVTAVLNRVVMPIAAVAVVFWIIWAGFSYVLAQGKPAEIQKAHQRLIWSLVGGGILLGAAGISKVVENTVNSFK